MDVDPVEDRYEPDQVGPRPILALEEDVVNKIAAGEIIQRPANALKELLENALDAGASTIKVTVKDGGLKLLQIQDDGTGIRHADMPILCHRFTTSKLRKYEDLHAMTTYGFRGEALASISHVAHLSVLTKTQDATCAWKATYSSGELVPPRPGDSREPVAAAGNQGTTITVEDLFFNVPTRLKALKNPSDEFSRVLDVVTQYAIHNSNVSFVCKKAGQSSPAISTPALGNTAQTIRHVYGQHLARELVHLPLLENKELGFKVEGWSTGPSYSSKKAKFLTFINQRLVDCPRLKKSVESLYAAFLPKGTFPWTYISLQIDPQNIDVNVHPTKKEVHFLNEDEIVEAVCAHIQETLIDSNSSRTFDLQQTLLPGASDPNEEEEEPDMQGEEPEAGISRALRRSSFAAIESNGAPKYVPSRMVRVDPKARTLDSFLVSITPPSRGSAEEPTLLPVPTSTQRKRRKVVRNSDEDEEDDAAGVVPPSSIPIDIGFVSHEKEAEVELGEGVKVVEGAASAVDIDLTGDDDDEDEGADAVSWKRRAAAGEEKEESEVVPRSRGIAAGGVIRASDCTLTSIKRLRQQVEKERHKGLAEVVRDHKFVGVIDYDLSQSLIQHSTKLYQVDHASIAEHLFYQLGLLQFGAMGRIKLHPPPDILPLIEHAISFVDEVAEEDRQIKAEAICKRLVERREMLEEYFSMSISEDGKVETLPLLLKGYTPNMDRLPEFLMRLGPGVDWTEEQACFESFLRELAFFYLPLPTEPAEPFPPPSLDPDDLDPPSIATKPTETADRKHELWQLEHVIFPTIRKHLAPPKSLMQSLDIKQIADLPDLYKVFERC